MLSRIMSFCLVGASLAALVLVAGIFLFIGGFAIGPKLILISGLVGFGFMIGALTMMCFSLALDS